MTGKAEQKNFGTPDETRAFERGTLDLVKIGGADIGLLTLQPGWRWSEHVKPLAGTEPTSPAPTRRDELTWMATKGTKWVLRRCTDLLPYLVAMAVRDCFRVRPPEPEAPAAVGVPETR